MLDENLPDYGIDRVDFGTGALTHCTAPPRSLIVWTHVFYLNSQSQRTFLNVKS